MSRNTEVQSETQPEPISRRPMTAYQAAHGLSPVPTEAMRTGTKQLFNHALAEEIANILSLDPQNPEKHLLAAAAAQQTGDIAEMRRTLSETMRGKNGTLTREDITVAVPLETVLNIGQREIREKLIAALRKIPEVQEQLGQDLN